MHGLKFQHDFEPSVYQVVSEIEATLMSVTDVGDNFMILVTVLVIFAIHIPSLLAKSSGANIQEMSPKS